MKREYLGMENNENLLNDLKENPNNIQKYLPKTSWEAFKVWNKTIKKL